MKARGRKGTWEEEKRQLAENVGIGGLAEREVREGSGFWKEPLC